MKKAIIILFMLAAVVSYAQDRIDRAPVEFEKVSQKLTNATHWYLGYDGKWNSYKNERGVNSFGDIQAKKLVDNGIVYYGLVMTCTGGYYDYPEIKQGFHAVDNYYIYVFTENDFLKLFNTTNEPFYCETFKVFSLKEDEQGYDILKEVKKTYPSKYAFCIYKSTDGMIRFLYGENIYFEYKETFKRSYWEVTEDEWNKLKLE